jgi:hypothetical protein
LGLEEASEGTTADSTRRSSPDGAGRTDAADTRDGDGDAVPDASVPEAEPSTGERPADRDAGPSLRCAVCGTDADAGAEACPLCRSTDLHPVDAVDPAGRAVGDAAASPLVEEAESSTSGADGPPSAGAESSRRDTDGNSTTVAASDDEVEPREAVDERSAPDGNSDASESADDDPDRFVGPGPTRTRTAESTDDEAVTRLRELRERDREDDA